MTSLLAAILEAWHELRVHKVRVLLSLIGVAASVAALTGVLGMGDVVREGMKDQAERTGGRGATLSINLYAESGQVPASQSDPLMKKMAERYRLDKVSRISRGEVGVQFPRGVQSVLATVVDPAYATILRTSVAQGRWFTDDDARRLAPAVIVNESAWRELGSPSLARQPGVLLYQNGVHSAVIVGVARSQWPEEPPSAYLLSGDGKRLGVGEVTSEYRVWVDPAQADQLRQTLEADLGAQLPGASVGVNRMDYLAYGDPLASLQWAVAGVAGVILLLGALGMLTVALVTVKYRVREIGIRRSFGATSGRIFVGVMMESLVATAVAGLLGVMLAVAVVKNSWVESHLAPGLDAYPPFPLGAALIGMGAAIVVGALAGAIPALIAIRVKVIDAIRF
ncbi:ABC transporter permease [Arthrobacter sp.]|uniref:ABC transporter permease n=1 Tax=Arthrobacter sp. TaxID=1667 RepID=UPI002586C57C|nr:ABC transporter permease [Arthrobacter sp.]